MEGAQSEGRTALCNQGTLENEIILALLLLTTVSGATQALGVGGADVFSSVHKHLVLPMCKV